MERQPGFPVVNLLDGCLDLGGGGIPADIAQGPGLSGQHDPVVGRIGRNQGKDTDLGLLIHHVADEFDTPVPGQHQIDQEHTQLQRFRFSRVPVASHAHDLDALDLTQAHRQDLPLAGTGIHHQQAYGLWAHGALSQ